MRIGRVVGNVVATVKHPFFEGRRLLLCDLIGPAGDREGGYVIAVDTVASGPGDTVLILDEGNSSRQIFGVDAGPIRTTIVGIVDSADES